jgi:hypothetical protein
MTSCCEICKKKIHWWQFRYDDLAGFSFHEKCIIKLIKKKVPSQ